MQPAFPKLLQCSLHFPNYCSAACICKSQIVPAESRQQPALPIFGQYSSFLGSHKMLKPPDNSKQPKEHGSLTPTLPVTPYYFITFYNTQRRRMLEPPTVQNQVLPYPHPTLLKSKHAFPSHHCHIFSLCPCPCSRPP